MLRSGREEGDWTVFGHPLCVGLSHGERGPRTRFIERVCLRTVVKSHFSLRLQEPRITREIYMEQILINLVAGALGGVGAGKSSPTFDLGTVGNIVSGLVGGGVLGQIVTLLLPSVMAAVQSGNLSVGGIISQAIAGGAGGAILTAIIGAIKNRAAA